MPSPPARSGALVIVTGLPASGKSTFVAGLAARTGLAVLCKDEIKEALLEELGRGDAAWSRRLSDAAFAELFARAARQLDGGGALALEGNFRQGEHEAPLLAALGGGADGAGVAPAPARASRARHSPVLAIAQVLCRAPESQRVARLEARVATAARHPGHRDAEALAALRSGAAAGPGAPSDRFLELPGLRLVYDSGIWSARADVLDALDAWLAAAVAPCDSADSRGD